jgi:hypothetical protein
MVVVVKGLLEAISMLRIILKAKKEASLMSFKVRPKK